MNNDTYSGILTRPSTDFNEVRDGRRSSLFYYDVDLSVARSVLAGTAIVLGVAGDSFYVDKNPVKTGAATVHFQDTTSGTAPAPVYCELGFIAKIPFTQLLIENLAQPGKIFRFFYGVDVDFQPGASSSVVVTGTVQTVDSGVSDVTNNRAFSLASYQGPSVGLFCQLNFSNQNLSTGPVCFIDAVSVSSNLATTAAFRFIATAAGTPGFTKNLGSGSVSNCGALPQYASAQLSGGLNYAVSLQAGVTKDIIFSPPIRLVGAGLGFNIANQVANSDMLVSVQYREF